MNDLAHPDLTPGVSYKPRCASKFRACQARKSHFTHSTAISSISRKVRGPAFYGNGLFALFCAARVREMEIKHRDKNIRDQIRDLGCR